MDTNSNTLSSQRAYYSSLKDDLSTFNFIESSKIVSQIKSEISNYYAGKSASLTEIMGKIDANALSCLQAIRTTPEAAIEIQPFLYAILNYCRYASQYKLGPTVVGVILQELQKLLNYGGVYEEVFENLNEKNNFRLTARSIYEVCDADNISDPSFTAGILINITSMNVLKEDRFYYGCLQGVLKILVGWSSTQEIKNSLLSIDSRLSQHFFEYSEDSDFLCGALLSQFVIEYFVACLNNKKFNFVYNSIERKIKNKLNDAMLHHERVKLNGRSLNDILIFENFKLNNFLSELINSRWINKNNVDESLFFKELCSFGGKMYGVFTDPELDKLKYVIGHICIDKNIVNESDQTHSATMMSIFKPDLFMEWLGESSNAIQVAPDLGSCGRKELFHRLINYDKFPDVIDGSETIVKQVLFDTRKKAPELSEVYQYFTYSPSNLERSIKRIVSAHSKLVVGDGESPFIDKDTLIFLHKHLTPFGLVDGCWLQTLVNPWNRDKDYIKSLYQIFYEEVGEGRYEYNHTNVYRKMMIGMGISLPEIGSEQFIKHPDFCDDSFMVPNYLLSLSFRTERYFPEMLGLTLAVEVTGLGGVYKVFIDNLAKHDLDSSFWKLHMSIDNLATGHTKQAVKIVQNYMHDIVKQQTTEVVNTVWERIWTGFLSFYILEGTMLYA